MLFCNMLLLLLFLKLFFECRYTDVKIFLDGEEFYAHKIILSSRSPILNDYFLGNPKTDAAGWNIMDNEDFIRIGRIDRELFGIILEFMYTGRIANSVFKVRERNLKLMMFGLNYFLRIY
jgi:hypothetical protein